MAVYLVTGSTDGIGLNTAQRLAAQPGATVLIHGRSRERLELAAERIKVATGRRVHAYRADLSRLGDVRALAEAVLTDHPSISVLINNAGVFETARRTSADGYELTWAVNVLAPFLLTRLLRDHVTGSVITTASISAASSIDWGNLQQERGYSAHGAYSLSKLSDVVMTLRLARLLQGTGSTVTSNTLDPGTVNTKMLSAGWGSIGMDVSQADSTFRLATQPELLRRSGLYYVALRERRPPAVAEDPVVQDRLWALWEEQVGNAW